MDQHLATVIIALISAATSLITILIQRTSGAIYKKMKEGTSMLEEENMLRNKIEEARRNDNIQNANTNSGYEYVYDAR